MRHLGIAKMQGRIVKPIHGGASFLLGPTLSGLKSVGEEESAYSGSSGSGLGEINKKLEKLMIKTKKSKPANIKFSM